MAVKKRGLGKGLGALLAENTTEDAGKTVKIRISDIMPNRDQPRTHFDEKQLSELADSIARHGVLQPILVRPLIDGGYQLVAGERRWRAATQAGLTEIPAVVRELSDQDAAIMAMVENLQREDLNPMEESLGYKALLDEQELTQEEVAKVVGKSRSAIANSLRLLNLPSQISDMVAKGTLSAGHARTILAFPDEKSQIEAASLAAKKNLSVRKLESMAKKATKQQKDDKTKAPAQLRNSFYDEVELALSDHLGRKVQVSNSGKGGTLQIEFYSSDDLRMLANEFDIAKK